MENLTKEQIKKYSEIFHVSEEFVLINSKLCDTLVELEEILFNKMEIEREQNIPEEISEDVQIIGNMLSKSMGVETTFMGAFKVPDCNCPFSAEEKDCKLCPLYKRNLVIDSFHVLEEMSKSIENEDYEEPEITDIMQSIIDYFNQNPNELMKIVYRRKTEWMKNK